MLQLLKSLLGESSRESANQPAPNASSKPSRAAVNFRAVSIASGTGCHAAGDATRRYLLREAPRLPLPNCAMAAKCSCKFRKHSDRRDGDRRLLGETATNRWFVGSERRKHAGRRTAAV